MIKLVALDLDGTLTQHKSKLEPECREVLSELSVKYNLLMVCAGGCERVYRQMDEFPIEIIGFYGMERSVSGNGKFNIIDRASVDHDEDRVMNQVKQLRSELGFANYCGDSVEFHNSGIITFPILGTTASLDEKLAFDPDRTIRRKCYSRVREVFDEYNVLIGGSSSFDIMPKPYRKLYALETHLAKRQICRSEVIYFGDDYGLGGNDSDIYNSDIKFIAIDNYKDFPQIAKEVLL